MLNNNNRFQLNRAALNVQPLVIKQHQLPVTGGQLQPPLPNTAVATNETDANQTNGGNLSPSILINFNDINSLLTSINTATIVPAPASVTTSGSTPTATAVAVVETTSSQHDENVASAAAASRDEKKFTQLGDYIFFAQQNQHLNSTPAVSASGNDLYGSAFNTKTKEVFFWKKFDKRDYMKKLEPYFIMDGATDKIYRFSEIIHECNYDETASANVYVLFNPHYGDLHSFMKEKKRLDEPEARCVFRQCVEAVQACHEHGIIIRDIKLKKFVFLDAAKTKIGLANLEDCLLLDEDADNDLIKSQQGCPAYVSPEVLNPIQTSYSGRLSDSWSLGIILYTLLVGRYPFHHPTIAYMFARIARGKFQIPASTNLSLDAKILLRALIRVKPDERLLPEEILGHNWFRQNEHETSIRFMASSSLSSLSSSLNNNNILNESKYLNKVNIGISLNSNINNNNNLNRFSLLTSNNNSTVGGQLTTANVNENKFLALKSTTSESNGNGNTNANNSSNSNDDTNNDDCIVPEFKI